MSDNKTKPVFKKKILIGPKNNKIEFDRLLYAEENGDFDILK